MIKEMKGKTLKAIILTALMFLFVVPGMSQNGHGPNNSNQEDSERCGMWLSAYRGFFKLKLYDDAYSTWWNAFNNCPSSSVRLYVDGVTMYKAYIEEAQEETKKEGLIDTLMLIYDQRMEYLGDEGNVLARKGKDILTYRGEDMERVYEAYEMLKKSMEIEGTKSRDATMLLYMTTGIALNKAGKIEDNQVIEDYFNVVVILDQLEGKSSRWAKARASIDEMMLNENILSCEALDSYFEPQFEPNKEDKIFLEKVITFYSSTDCERSDMYVAASENLYRIDPGPKSAHNLAILFITMNDFEKAANYLKEAVQGEETEAETRAEWYYELAVVSNAIEDYCEAVKYAREAINLKSDYGKAYVTLGDAFIASRDNLGDDFEQRTAFWAAADVYQKAISLDPSLAGETNKKLNIYTRQYPNSEDVFFRDFQEGDSYQVKGCINVRTTVRPRK
jgi:tetratricopeptide (TPR) repeat protein